MIDCVLHVQNGGGSFNKSGTLQTKSVTASQLATDSPAKVNGHASQGKTSLFILSIKCNESFLGCYGVRKYSLVAVWDDIGGIAVITVSGVLQSSVSDILF